MEKGLPKAPASPAATEITHVDDVLGVLRELHLSEMYADVVFVVQGERIHAHRAILASRSEYFRALLFGSLAEAQKREINLDFEPEPFKEMLRYLYTGCLSVATTSANITKTLAILKLADFLNFPKLVSQITKLVELDLALHNVTAVLNFAVESHLDELASTCLDLMDDRALDYIQHESFRALSKVLVEKILQRDSFYAPEVDIFRAAMLWYRVNASAENKSVFRHIRLSIMEKHEIVNVVEPTEVFEDDQLFAAIVARTGAKNLPYRHCIAKNKMMPLVPIFTEETGAVFELAVTTSINHIHANLVECYFSYTVDVSRDNIHWQQVIDYTKFLCKSSQDLYFERRPVRYIKFAWHANQSAVLSMKTSYAMYSDDVPELVEGIIAPIENVITNENATFLGCSFDGDLISAGNCGKILPIIKFNQPYHISSLRWSAQNHSNLRSLEIFTSIDGRVWESACTGEGSLNWNHCTFEPRTVLFVQIYVPCSYADLTGIERLKFEMPSQDPDFVAQQMFSFKRLKTA